MSDKKLYTKADFDRYTAAVKSECEQTLLKQRERIDELRAELAAAEAKIAVYEGQKDLIYKAITAALKKADDMERVSLMRYNQEIAQLKSFHDKWVGYYHKIIEKYPLSDELVATGRINAKIKQTLDRAGDIEAQYESERARLLESIRDGSAERETAAARAAVAKKSVTPAPAKKPAPVPPVTAAAEPEQDYADRAPSGFSFQEALHPKQDLKDIMRELGIIMDEE